MSPAAIDHPDPPKDDASAPGRHERRGGRSSSPRQPPNRDRTHSDARPEELPPNGRPHTGTQPAAVEPGSRRKHEYEPGRRLIKKAAKGRGYQARGYIYSPPLGFINLGIYRGEQWQDEVVDERMAGAVAEEYLVRSRMPGACPLGVFLDMQRAKKIRPDVAPPGAQKKKQVVRRLRDKLATLTGEARTELAAEIESLTLGRGDWVCRHFCRLQPVRNVVVPGTFATALDASRALFAELRSRL